MAAVSLGSPVASGEGYPQPKEGMVPRIQTLQKTFSEGYQDALIRPLLKALSKEGPIDSAEEHPILWHLAEAVLQRGEHPMQRHVHAFQELVGDFYDSLLGSENRQKTCLPEHIKYPPLVVFHGEHETPFCVSLREIQKKVPGVQVEVVVLPEWLAEETVSAWAIRLGKMLGASFLQANQGLHEELKGRVSQDVCLEEMVSDSLGALHLGSAAAVAYKRSFIVQPRMAFVSAVFKEMGIKMPKREECEFNLGDEPVGSIPEPKQIVGTALKSLDGRSIREIRMWDDADQKIAECFAQTLFGNPADLPHVARACHVLAGAMIASTWEGAEKDRIFEHMVDLLAGMHKRNGLRDITLTTHVSLSTFRSVYPSHHHPRRDPAAGNCCALL